MSVAPFESCVACYRGDVTTVVVLEGEAEFIIASIHGTAGIPLDDAVATFHGYAEHELGCDPGKVPSGRLTFLVRLCGACANKTGVVVVPIKDVGTGEPVHAYRLPE